MQHCKKRENAKNRNKRNHFDKLVFYLLLFICGCANLDYGIDSIFLDGGRDGTDNLLETNREDGDMDVTNGTPDSGTTETSDSSKWVSDLPNTSDEDHSTDSVDPKDTNSEEAGFSLGDKCTEETALVRCGNASLCVDGVCCDSPCTGVCMACNISGKEGECTSHAARRDPDGECGVCEVCDGAPNDPNCITADSKTDVKQECGQCGMCNGNPESPACVPVPEGQDPLDACEPEDIRTCGTSGHCDGTGACQLYDSSFTCGVAYCDNGILFESRCNGVGACEEIATSCEGYSCQSADGCVHSCEDDRECGNGFDCIDGACIVESPLNLGEACRSNAFCRSGFCVDSVCCDERCDGECQSCKLTGSQGVCTAIANGEDDPDEPCSDALFCNGEEYCLEGVCVSNGNPCDEWDDNLCNDCNEIENSCIQPKGTVCDASVANDCRKSDKCDDSGVCVTDLLPDKIVCGSDGDNSTDDICQNGTCVHITKSDDDEDGIADSIDNCPDTKNPTQIDSDKDGYGNACDVCAYNPQGHTTGCEDLRVLMKWNGTTEITSHLYPYIKLTNAGTVPIYTAGLKIVYWYTWDDGTRKPSSQVAECLYIGLDWSGLNRCYEVATAITPLSNSDLRTNANYVWTTTLNTNTFISPGATTNHWEIRVRMSYEDWDVTYDLTNDYSFDLNDDYYETTKIAVYRGDNLIWGEAP